MEKQPIKIGDVVRYYGQARKYTEAVIGGEATLKYFNERQESKIVTASVRDLVIHVEEPKPIRRRA